MAAGVTVSAAAIRFLLDMLPWLKRPPCCTLYEYSQVLSTFCISAFLITLATLLTLTLWLRQQQPQQAPLVLAGALLATGLLLGGLAMEIFQAAAFASTTYRQFQLVGQPCDVLAIMVTMVCLLLGTRDRRIFVEPRWSWSAALALSVLPFLAASTMWPGYSLNLSMWFRVAIYPMAFALCWTIWQDQREPTMGGKNGSLLGIILHLAAVYFLFFELLLGDAKSGGPKAASIIVLLVDCLNALALLLYCGFRLVRDRTPFVERLSLFLGLAFLFIGTLPKIPPPWIGVSFSLIFRLGINKAQAGAGMGLIIMARIMTWLRRRDPLGGAPMALLWIWAGLACAYLLSITASEWLWTYEIWVKQVQYESDINLRLQITNAPVVISSMLVLALAPSVFRTLKRLWLSENI